MLLRKSEGFEILRVGAILFAITALSAFLLAFVNSFTAPVIAENNRLAEETAMKKVLPSGENFKLVDISLEENSSVDKIYSAGEAGVVVTVSPRGYGGAVSMVVGIDGDYKVTGVEIISQSETAGLGANCTNEEFREQFKGKSGDIKVVKSGAGENEIDAISSATITSKAVTKGVNEAVAIVKKIRGGE